MTMANPLLDQDRVMFLSARRASSTKRALLTAWPREDRELPVVEIEVDWARFSTLNHRTKAEQLREISRAKDAHLFSTDPLGQEAQEAQFRILSSQEGFEALKADLKERRQQDPAVITAEGVLINGNRRAAALRSLYRHDNHLDARYIRCLVLPDDATAAELVDLETELQIARDFKEDYSWVNEAMLIEELFEREGKQFDRVARKMHRDADDVRGLYDKIQQLHQLVALSNGVYLHIDFKDNESAFDELAKHIRNKPADEADSVRSTYFLGTLAGVNYRDLRNLRRSDAATLVRKEMEDDPSLHAMLTTFDRQSAAPGGSDALDELLGDRDTTAGIQGVLGHLATKRRDEVLVLADGNSALVGDLYATIASAITAAAREAQEEQRDTTAIRAPFTRIANAIREVERCAAALPRARGFTEWQENEFRKQLASLAQLLPTLERED